MIEKQIEENKEIMILSFCSQLEKTIRELAVGLLSCNKVQTCLETAGKCQTDPTLVAPDPLDFDIPSLTDGQTDQDRLKEVLAEELLNTCEREYKFYVEKVQVLSSMGNFRFVIIGDHKYVANKEVPNHDFMLLGAYEVIIRPRKI